MKNLFYFLFLLSGYLFSQSNYYLLPNQNQFSLYEKSGQELLKLESMPFQYTELYAFDKDELVIVSNDSTKFHYGKILNKKFREEIIQEFPDKFIINTIELKDQFVYLGGSWSEGEIFYVFDLQTENFHSVPIPDEAFQPGKAIDDILFIEDKIIAVDNIIEPKYLIYYLTKDLPELKVTEVFMLPFNGPYEHIYKGDISGDYLILQSSTYSGWIGGGHHISVLKSKDLNSNFSLSTFPKEFSQNYMKWNDIMLFENKIFIALVDNSLGVFAIKNEYFSNTDNGKFDGYKEISPNKIKIHLRLKNEPIKLLPFSSEEIIVILENGQGQKSFERIKFNRLAN